MIVARKKKKENVVEYLLYMWQIEDVIRAARFDMDTIRQTVVSRYGRPEDEKNEISRWYEELIEMMRTEGVTEKGHLRINTEVMDELSGLHLRLLKSPREMIYSAAYSQALPAIVQLRAKSGGNDMPEPETCLTAIYGYLMLKMQQKEISAGTEEAVRQVAAFLSILAQKYRELSYNESNSE
jgi:hypothetical protein